jgi:hypothetical protein
MKSCRRLLVLSAAIVGSVPCAQAHHGQEFLVVQDAAVPSLWTGVAFGSLEWSKDGDDNTFSTEPGLMVGIAPRVAIGGTVGFTDESGSWAFESVAPTMQIQLTPSDWRVRVSVVAGYHFAYSSADSVDSPPTRTSTASTAPPPTAPAAVQPPVPTDNGSIDPDPVPCGPEFGPDAPPCPDPATTTPGRKLRHAMPPPPAPAAPAPSSEKSQSTPKKSGSSSTSSSTSSSETTSTTDSYDGIHRHHENHAFARMIVEADLTSKDKIIFNLIGLWPEGSKPAWGYACGVRHSFSHTWATGLEAIGDFGEANEHELVLGGYCSPNHHLALKIGAGMGLTSSSPDFSVRTGVVWRF